MEVNMEVNKCPKCGGALVVKYPEGEDWKSAGPNSATGQWVYTRVIVLACKNCDYAQMANMEIKQE